MKTLHLFAAFLLAFAAGPAKAELPPQVYIELQQKAGEELKIRVEEVASKPKGFFDRSSFTETVKAAVIQVVRSKSGLKKGDVISISYQRLAPKDGWVGPSPAPPLKKGMEYTAFLDKGEDGIFSIAARGMSFSKLGE